MVLWDAKLHKFYTKVGFFVQEYLNTAYPGKMHE